MFQFHCYFWIFIGPWRDRFICMPNIRSYFRLNNGCSSTCNYHVDRVFFDALSNQRNRILLKEIVPAVLFWDSSRTLLRWLVILQRYNRFLRVLEIVQHCFVFLRLSGILLPKEQSPSLFILQPRQRNSMIRLNLNEIDRFTFASTKLQCHTDHIQLWGILSGFPRILSIGSCKSAMKDLSVWFQCHFSMRLTVNIGATAYKNDLPGSHPL